jgi:hypothetical protein
MPVARLPPGMPVRGDQERGKPERVPRGELLTEHQQSEGFEVGEALSSDRVLDSVGDWTEIAHPGWRNEQEGRRQGDDEHGGQTALTHQHLVGPAAPWAR